MPSTDSTQLCAFTFADGRHCRSPRHSSESALCLDHERALHDLRQKIAATFAISPSKPPSRSSITPAPPQQLLSTAPATTNLSVQNTGSPSKNSNRSDSLCAFSFSDGRQCRMLRHSKKSQYCVHHERKLHHLRELDQTASAIAEPLENDFVPATALTHSLTRVFRAVAEGRFDPKTASALSRVASTLLKSINASSHEFQSCYREGYWRQLIRDHYNDLPDYQPPEPRQPRRQPDNSTDNSKSDAPGSESSNS